jgi:multiple sugar transport system substrate-binding protein
VIEFMTSPEMQKHFAVLASKAPARRALYKDPDVLKANPHFAQLAPVFETAAPRPRSPIYPQISHILQRTFHAAISDPESDVAALAKDAAEKISKAQSRR